MQKHKSIIDQVASRLKRGDQVDLVLESQRVPASQQESLLKDLIALEICFMNRNGGQPKIEDYRERFPAVELDALFFQQTIIGTENADEQFNSTALFASDSNDSGNFAVSNSEGIGAILSGKYELVDHIGAGGMGSVFLAKQHQPVKRKVAVKIIKAGMDTKAVLARFEAERQALAMMDHPNIARVLDAGATAAGRPYFVMELVQGQPITKYCDQHKLDVRGRLKIFISVCQAIQHAHQKGIIHRDLKPGNVLVAEYDGKSTAKVIDFGLAKATGQMALTEGTLETAASSILGTPEYMSPEQADWGRSDIDTRTDIYSLGVLLYELLTGTTPVNRKNMKRVSVVEILRIVCDVDAPLASQRISSTKDLDQIAESRGTTPSQLSRILQGELDWILARSLEKDRSRRYATALSFAEDIQRYLNDEVVEASPPSASYRLQKFVHRHRGQVMAVAMLAIALILGVIGTSIGMVRARWAKQETQQEQIKTLAALRERTISEERARKLAEQEKAAKELAQLATDRAVEQEQEAQRQLHRANLAAYSALVLAAAGEQQQGNFPGSMHLLDEAAWNLCGWEHRWLSNLASRRWRQLFGHKREIQALAWSSNGDSLFTSCDSKTHIWDTSSLIDRQYAGHVSDGFGAHEIRILPVKDRVCSIGWSGQFCELNIWNPATCETILVQRGISNPAFHTGWSLSGDGHRVAVCDYGRVQIWDCETGQVIGHQLPKLHSNSIALNYDGSKVAIATQDQQPVLSVWNLADSNKLFDLNLAGERVAYQLQFSKDDKFVICCADQQPAQWIGTFDGQPAILLSGEGPTEISKDGFRIARREANRIVIYQRTAEGVTVLSQVPPARIFRFSSDACTLLTVDETAFPGLREYETSTGLRINSTPLDIGYITKLEFSHDQSHLAIGTSEGGVWIVDRTGAPDFSESPGPIWQNVKPDGEAHVAAHHPSGRSTAMIIPSYRDDTPDRVSIWSHRDQSNNAERTNSQVFLEAPSGVKLTTVTYSPDGNWIAAGGEEIAKYSSPDPQDKGEITTKQSTVLLWDVRTSQLVDRLTQTIDRENRTDIGRPEESLRKMVDLLQHSAKSICFTGDQQRIWTIDDGPEMTEWSVSQKKVLRTIKKFSGEPSRIQRCAFSHDGSRIAMWIDAYNGPETFIAGLWDLDSQNPLLKLSVADTNGIGALAIHPAGSALAYSEPISSNNREAGRLIRVHPANATQQAIVCRGHRAPVSHMRYDASGTRLISTDLAGGVIVWESATGDLLLRLQGNPGPTSIHLDDSGCLKVFGNSGNDLGSVLSWRAGENLESRTFYGHMDDPALGVQSVDWHPLNREIVSASQHQLQTWNADTGEPTASTHLEFGSVSALRFSADGASVYGIGSRVRKWDTQLLSAPIENGIHFHESTGLDVSFDGTKLFTSGGSRQIVEWDAMQLKPTRVLGAPKANLNSPHALVGLQVFAHAVDKIVIAIHPSGKFLASAADRFWTTGDKIPPQLKLWNLETGTEVACVATGDTELQGWGGRVHCLKWMPDGQHLLSANQDGLVRIHDPQTLEVIKTLEGHSGPVLAMTINPRTGEIYYGGEDCSVRVWNNQGELQSILRGHSGSVRCLRLSPRGDELASASADGTVKIWAVKP